MGNTGLPEQGAANDYFPSTGYMAIFCQPLLQGHGGGYMHHSVTLISTSKLAHNHPNDLQREMINAENCTWGIG